MGGSCTYEFFLFLIFLWVWDLRIFAVASMMEWGRDEGKGFVGEMGS